MSPHTNPSLLLPPQARLLHIGPMKTGTTALQMAANRQRDDLLAHGVRYPGRDVNHRMELGALLEWSVKTRERTEPLHTDLLDVASSAVPRREVWDSLMAEIDADQERRVLLTHEWISQVDDDGAKRIVNELGERLHICLTLRAPGRIVPSLWAQGVKSDARSEALEPWLARFFGSDAERPLPGRYGRAYDQGALVQRWADLVGADKVTVIVVDKDRPNLLADSFASMLGLPTGLLKLRPNNESLSAIDTELLRHVNDRLQHQGADWKTYYELVRTGAADAGRREPSAGQPRVVLPPWAAEIAERDGQRFAKAIAGSGVRVVGDLEQLGAESPSAEWHDITEVPINVAAGAVTASVMAGQQGRKDRWKREVAIRQELADVRRGGLRARVAEIPPERRAEAVASALSTRDLVAALKLKVRRMLTRS